MKHFCGTVKLTPDIIISTLQAKQNYLKPLPINHNGDNLNQFKCLPLSTFPASPWIITTASAWTPSCKGWKSWWTRSCEYAQHRNDYEVSDLSGKHCGSLTEMCDRTLSRCYISDVFTCFFPLLVAATEDPAHLHQQFSARLQLPKSQLKHDFFLFNFLDILQHHTQTHTHNKSAFSESRSPEKQSYILVNVSFFFYLKQNCDFVSYWTSSLSLLIIFLYNKTKFKDVLVVLWFSLRNSAVLVPCETVLWSTNNQSRW